MSELHLRNRQRTRAVSLRFLRQVVRALLADLPPARRVELGVHLVSGPEIVHLNETYLHHAGSTDVITFNHAPASPPGRLHGEIFVCVDEAVRQARRYRTSWQSELVRYVVHGLLHLQGYDDQRAGQRRRMKHAEDCLLRRLAAQFSFLSLGRARHLRHRPLAGAPG